MTNDARFWERFSNQKVFLGFKVTGSGSDITKMPIGVDGKYGAAAGDLSRLGSYDEAARVADYTAISLTQPLMADGKLLVCLDFDWKRSANGKPNDEMKASMVALINAGHEFESSASGMGAHIWVLMEEENLPKKYTFSDGCGFEVFSGIPGQRANVIFTGINARGSLMVLDKWEFYQPEVIEHVKKEIPILSTYKNRTSDIPKILGYVPNNDMEYDDWLKVGMAIKDELGDGGFGLWDSWSSQSSKYDPAVMKTKWESFKGQGVGFGSVVLMAQRNGMPKSINIGDVTKSIPKSENIVEVDGLLTIKRSHKAFEEAVKLISDAKDLNDLIDRVCPKIRSMSGIDRLSVSMLGDDLKIKAKQFKSIIPIAEARQMLMTDEIKAVEQNRSKAKFQKTNLAKDWVFLEQSCEFYKPETGERISAAAINIKFMADMPEDDNGNRKEPSKMFAEFGGKCIYTDMYVPEVFNSEDPFFSINGIDCVNSYSDKTTPLYEPNWKQLDRWKVVEQHIYKMFSAKEDAKTLIEWLAHNVQNPGKKILWACIVIGIPGDGKSSIARVMSAAMGHRNVKNIGLDEVKSSFTSWAEGACLGVIEELRVTGQNRHEVMDRLKPFITNKSVAIVKKGKDGIDKPNTQNYLCFSNHADALALDDSDRRWGVFSTKYQNREQVVEQNNSVYWETLYDAIDNGGGEIRSWLLSIDLSGFNKNVPPATTQAKKRMIAESKHDICSNLEELLVGTAYGYSENVIIPKYLASDLKKIWGQNVSAKFLVKNLRDMGYVPVSDLSELNKVFWWNDATHKPYVKRLWMEEKLLTLPKNVDKDVKKDFINETMRTDLKTSEVSKF
jgi:hypothetical protein